LLIIGPRLAWLAERVRADVDERDDEAAFNLSGKMFAEDRGGEP